MLTSEQVDHFLSVKLGINDWREKARGCTVDFLKELDKQFKLALYYESLTWGARSEAQLCPPTVDEVVHQALNCSGGACLQINYFMYLLLQYLGYDVIVVGATVIVAPLPWNHIIVIARFPLPSGDAPTGTHACSALNSAENYLVDPGFFNPIPCIVNLNRVPQSYKAGGFQVEYRYNSDGDQFEIYLIGGNPVRGPHKNSEEIKFCDFDLVPRIFEDFDVTMTKIFTKPECSFFLNTTCISRYISLEGAERYTYVGILGRQLNILTSERREVTEFESYVGMMPEIQKYFPKLDPIVLRKALENYDERQLKLRVEEKS